MHSISATSPNRQRRYCTSVAGTVVWAHGKLIRYRLMTLEILLSRSTTCNLKAKQRLLPGAAGGIGRATVLRFVGEGAPGCRCRHSAGRCRGNSHIVGADYPDAVIARGVDASRGDQVERLISETVSHFGKLDIIFSNAAIMADGSVVDLPEEDWDALFDANVKGHFSVENMVSPPCVKAAAGSFIITASVNSFYAESDIAGYCATKGRPATARGDGN